MISWQLRWLLGAILALAMLALAAVAVWFGANSALLPFVPDHLVPFWAEVVMPLGAAVLPWLLLLLLLATLLSFMDERLARPKGDLDRLLRRKRGGLLPEALRRERKRAPWGAARREEGVRAALPEEYLDRLLTGQHRRRRRTGS